MIAISAPVGTTVVVRRVKYVKTGDNEWEAHLASRDGTWQRSHDDAFGETRPDWVVQWWLDHRPEKCDVGGMSEHTALQEDVRDLQAEVARLRRVVARVEALADEKQRAFGSDTHSAAVLVTDIRALLTPSGQPEPEDAPAEAHVLSDRFCHARTAESPEWATGRKCPICSPAPVSSGAQTSGDETGAGEGCEHPEVVRLIPDAIWACRLCGLEFDPAPVVAPSDEGSEPCGLEACDVGGYCQARAGCEHIEGSGP